MSCEKYTEQLPLYGINDLPAPKKSEIEDHLKVCVDCRQALNEYKEIIGQLKNDQNTTIDETEEIRIKQSIYKSLLEASLKPKQVHSSYRYIIQAAAAIVIFFSGYFISSYYTDYIEPKQTMHSAQVNTELSSFKSYKHSKAGLKLIAKGREALVLK